MRQRIDITDMEVRTKIRAKYLRALENEEWDLLPGPTYVKSFLRTYADALGLDSRALVEEYKLRHEGLATGELHPIRPPSARERDKRRRRGNEPAGVPVAAVVGFVLAAIVAVLILIGGDDEPDESGGLMTTPVQTQTTQEANGPTETREQPRPPARPRTVRLQLVPTGPVSVCLVNAAGEVLIGNQILQPGQPSRTYRSRRFRLVLGNNAVRLKLNGKDRTVPPSPTVIAYSITREGRKDLPQDQRPSCS